MNWNWQWPDAKGTLGFCLSFGLVILIIVLIVYPSQVDVHPAILAVLTTLAGALTTNLTTVVNYYFGSSAESKTKGEVISKIASEKQSPGVPP